MTTPFVVCITPRYERLSDKLLKRHPDFDAAERRAKEILESDPYNRARRHHIKKLEGVASGEASTVSRWVAGASVTTSRPRW